MQHSTRSVYLELTQLFIFSQLKVLFIPDKEYISVNTKSKNTEKQQCVHFGVRDTPHPQIYFSWENVNFPVDQTNLITVDSKRTEQNFFSFGYLKCSNPNNSPSNADAYFESTKIKNRLFSKTVSPQQ
jgi:hypothetical protein